MMELQVMVDKLANTEDKGEEVAMEVSGGTLFAFSCGFGVS